MRKNSEEDNYCAVQKEIEPSNRETYKQVNQKEKIIVT